MEGQSEGRWYLFVIKEKLDRACSRWFEGMDLIERQDETELRGLISDRSALFGTIDTFRDLGLHLLSVSILQNEKEK